MKREDNIDYVKSVDGSFAPALNDRKEPENYSMHPSVSADFGALEGYLSSKEEREWLKLCAFYNKYFPSLSSVSSYYGASYNVVPFTVTDLEIQDVGTGISKNYLKTAIDTVVARLKNITYEVRIQSGSPLILLEMYKRQIERYFKSQIRSNHLERLVTECFHDAAILGYSHVLMDPWAKNIRKINDWELGIYETEFEKGDLKRVLVVDKAFPVASLAPYIDGLDSETVRSIVSHQDHVELCLYMDCFQHKKFAMIDGRSTPLTDYPYDSVLLVTFCWDVGVKKMLTTSLFDLLFPLQRQINKLSAKLTTIYMNYKGPVPVISTAGDVDAISRNLTNKSGEILILSGAVADVSKMVGQIDPIPLNPALNAEIEALKGNMLELAGVQEISMNLDNLRSAAAVVALDQLRDARFESQLFLMAEFVEQMLINIVRFNAGMAQTERTEIGDIPWQQMLDLVNSSYVEIVPVHGNDPENKPVEPPEDFQLYVVDKFIMDIINGDKTYDDMDYTVNRQILKKQAVNKLLRFKALGGDFRELEELVVLLFVDDIKSGVVSFSGDEPETEVAAGAPEPAEEGAAK